MKMIFAPILLLILAVSLYGDTALERQYRESFWNIYTEALRGDKVAQYQAGVIFERGLGVEKNETKSAEWYEKAAYQGHMDAQYNIAIMYAAGRGVEQDDAKAMMWFALAAKQGDKESRQLLLSMIDGKVMTKKNHPSNEVGLAIDADSQLVPITPVTLVCKESSSVCSGYGGKGDCKIYKAKSVFTSKEKKGRFYKISGIVVNHKWQDYGKEGWIDQESVEVRE